MCCVVGQVGRLVLNGVKWRRFSSSVFPVRTWHNSTAMFFDFSFFLFLVSSALSPRGWLVGIGAFVVHGKLCRLGGVYSICLLGPRSQVPDVLAYNLNTTLLHTAVERSYKLRIRASGLLGGVTELSKLVFLSTHYHVF